MWCLKKKRHLDGGQGRGYSETRHPTLKLSQMLVVLKSKFHEFGLFGINFLCSIRNICSGFLQDTFQIKKEKKLQTRLNFINWQTQITIILIHLQSEDQWTWTKDGSFLICHKNKQTNKKTRFDSQELNWWTIQQSHQAVWDGHSHYDFILWVVIPSFQWT